MTNHTCENCKYAVGFGGDYISEVHARTPVNIEECHHPAVKISDMDKYLSLGEEGKCEFFEEVQDDD